MTNEHLAEMIRLAEEMGLYDLPLEVCVVHRRFVPCRKNEGCEISSDPKEVDKVREWQTRRP